MINPVVRVLLVEDHATDALLARDELAHAVGVVFTVAHTERLQAAIDRLAAQPFDVVLLDLNLPDSDGLNTFHRLHAVAPGVPVLVLSHHADEQMALQAVQIGAQDYLVKGQAPGLLVRAIRHAIERVQGQRALHESQQRYQRLVEWSPIGVAVHKMGRLVYVNPATIAMFGAKDAGELIDTPVLERVHPDYRQAVLDRVQAGLADGVVFPVAEEKFLRLDGAVLDVEVYGTPIQYEGEPAIQVSMVDIAERRAAQSKLQQAANVFTHAREGILIADARGRIIEVNAMFSLITGYSREDALGRDPVELLHSGRQGDGFYAERLRVIAENGHWTGEVWNRRKNGEIFPEMLTISAVCDEAGVAQSYVALFTDITAIKEHQRQMEHIAHYDPLTSLPNRVLLADRLQQAMAQCQRRGQSLAVAFLDLDGFKSVNDRHGHDVGDQLLIALAQRMKAALRDGDSLARFGGDEFVAVLVDLERPQDCEPVLERLLRAAADPVTLGHVVLQVSASIGVTLYPQDGSDVDLLMRHADQAMYQAKQAGKNRYHLFDVAHDTAVKTQREDLEHIRHALEQREFVLYYQPKVNMRTGAVVGAEALIRWQHPERGLLAPGTFLPVIEDHPLSIEVGEWVIGTALAQMSAWQAMGLDLPVSVNIGARQLQQDGFVTRLVALLGAHPDVPSHCLELEVLETSALQDIHQVSRIMHACRAVGVCFALDDFGTGYSSLTYLKHLSAEVIKIDQSFVRDMLSDPDDLAIVKGVIGLATAFRRQVIAEGVETAAHGKCLLALGCELAQGYGIAHPMPASELPRWTRTWRQDPCWKI